MGGTFAERFAGESLDVLEAILANSRDCIKLINSAGELEYLSDSAKGALGIDDPAQLLGNRWRDLWPESEHPSLDRALAAAWSGEKSCFDGATVGDDGTPRHWEVVISPVRGIEGHVTHVLAVSTDVTAHVQLAERERQRWERAENRADFAGVVSRELRHRLKNQLAVVNAVAKLLARHTTNARELALKLEEKLIAMGRAQDLSSIERDGPLTAAQAIREVLDASGAGERISVGDLPIVTVPEESIQQIALLMGELQTNALKHGALRNESGRVDLSGVVDGEVLTLRWTEHGDEPVAPVQAGNGGFQLISRLGSASGKKPAIDWRPDGITVTIHTRIKP